MNPAPNIWRAGHEPPETQGTREETVWIELLEELRAARQDRADAVRKVGGGGSNGNGRRLTLDIVLQIITAVSATLIVALILAGFAIDHRVTVLEGSRFTNQEATVLEQRLRVERMDYVQAQIDQLRREIYAAIGKTER